MSNLEMEYTIKIARQLTLISLPTDKLAYGEAPGLSTGVAPSSSFQGREYETNKVIYQNCEHLKKGAMQMTIYEELIQRVSSGETFRIDFEKQTMKIGKQKLVNNGEYAEDRDLFGDSSLDVSDVLSFVEELYAAYKYSLPSERADSKRRKYFKALSMNEIADEQLFVAKNREVAQAKLEGFILCMVLDGHFVWNESEMGKWFYQSKNDPDLVILRKWIKRKGV